MGDTYGYSVDTNEQRLIPMKFKTESELRLEIRGFILEEDGFLTTYQVAQLYNSSISRINRLTQ
jgi:hypothetical protein